MKKRGGGGGMALYKNKLEELGIKAVLARAGERLIIIKDMRDYIRTIPVEQLIREISEITSPAVLRMIQAAGVPAGAFETLVKQIEKVGR